MKRLLVLPLLAVACHNPGASSSASDAGAAAPSSTTASPAATPKAAATASAAAWSGSGVYTPASPKTLADFLPPSLEGAKLEKLGGGDPMMALPADLYAGAYLSAATRKSININIGKTPNLAASRAQFHKLKPGQTKNNPAAHLAFEGFEVQGFPVERTLFLGTTKKSEAIALLANKVDLRVSVQPSDAPDEAVDLMKHLDLKAIEAFAKRL